MQPEPEFIENRLFPRIQARCPVLYRIEGMARRSVAMAADFSATGVKMICKQAVAVHSRIEIEFKPGSDKAVPAMSAEGQVVRCESNGEGEFLVACRFTRVRPSQGSTHSTK